MSVGAEEATRSIRTKSDGSGLAVVAVIGAIAGASLTALRGRSAQRTNQIPALPHRIPVGGAMAAPLGRSVAGGSLRVVDRRCPEQWSPRPQ